MKYYTVVAISEDNKFEVCTFMGRPLITEYQQHALNFLTEVMKSAMMNFDGTSIRYSLATLEFNL